MQTNTDFTCVCVNGFRFADDGSETAHTRWRLCCARTCRGRALSLIMAKSFRRKCPVDRHGGVIDTNVVLMTTVSMLTRTDEPQGLKTAPTFEKKSDNYGSVWVVESFPFCWAGEVRSIKT